VLIDTKMTIHRAGPVYSHFSIDEHRAGPVYSLVLSRNTAPATPAAPSAPAPSTEEIIDLTCVY